MKINTKLITGAMVFLLILLWSYAATSKILEHFRFVFQMHLSPLPVVRVLAPFLSWLLPIAEGCVVIFLLTDRFRLTGVYCSLFLLVIFEIYIVAMLLSGLHLPCTCGGIISKMSWKQHLLFNGFFILISLIFIIIIKKEKRTLVNLNHNQIKSLLHA